MRNNLDSSVLYQNYFNGDKQYDFPSRVILEFTNNCNLSCCMCPRRYMNSRKGYLSQRLFKKIIDEIASHPKVSLIPFFRGESLLHPEFIGMLKYIKSKGIAPVQLATNGLLLDDKLSDAILGLNIDFISFSLDGLNAEIYNKVRRGGDYNLVINNIESFLKKKADQKRSLPNIQISIVETEKTKKSIKAFVAKWRRKVNRIRVYPEHSKGGEFGSLKNKKNGLIIHRKPCIKLITGMAIYWDGNVAICNHDWNRKEFIGSLKKNLIAEIWNSKKYLKLRKMHFENAVGADTICGKCDCWKAYYLPKGVIGEIYTS